ncbi:adenosine deaminase family protein [Mycolicibacterium komossense]|uniref:Adenosine deaminase family protein n=1 Tax=Mycolicibacterium komossense TaxID=1779 RepID=A0ABT3CIS6_9MYCO|nr:adenosine deaminase family protein [Mycolicibacterium komossense]MCV7229361.1 adenosine deaminase family protein [Mycolicibacterium komossense]
MRSLRDLPKAHLHAHLDGSYPLAAVQELAQRRRTPFDRPDQFPDVWSFFDAYGTVPALVESREDLAGLCRALVHQEAAQGVVYLEPAIEPQLYSTLGTLTDVTDTILKAFAEAADDTGIEVGATLTVNTDSDEEIAVELASVAATFAGAGVTALGTAGFVEPAGLHRYTGAADKARAAGLPIVSHAGQTGGPDSVAEALDVVGASRLSHGFRSVESSELVDRLAAERICCDICPVSNVALGVVADLGVHPAPALLAAGVPVTLNADDQLWFGVSITGQYEIGRQTWGLDDHTLAGFARSGTSAQGMSTSTRNQMTTAIAAWLQEEPR